MIQKNRSGRGRTQRGAPNRSKELKAARFPVVGIGASAGGLEEIKTAGGITFAQNEASAKYAGMPSSAGASGSADYVLPPREIATELVRIGRHPHLKRTLALESQIELMAVGDVTGKT